MWVCEAGDQRCLLGPFVFSSWDRMAWILLRIFFWWPIMVMPRLRMSLENKDTVRQSMGWPHAHRDTAPPCMHTPRTSPGPLSWLFSICPSAQGCLGPVTCSTGKERLSFPLAQSPDRAAVTAGGGAGARGTARDRLVGDKIDALKLDSVLVRCP